MSATSSPVPSLKPSDKAVAAYYVALGDQAKAGTTHEMGLRSAFHNLLSDTAKNQMNWTLVAEKTLKSGIRPDGTIQDQWTLHRGFWEAKDLGDDLDAEIKRKIARGYPLTNIIFENTRHGVLFQNGREALRVDIRDKERLVQLLNAFYGHVIPDVQGFEQAVIEFQDRIPYLARALLDRIDEAHREGPRFQEAFESLMELCRSSLNPNISPAAVDEMLVQHLLTERLFTRVFSNQDFVNRNVVAVEIEKVIRALVGRSFSREEFLRTLDPFYKAIENAAATIEEFSQKQEFLNHVYERFFQGYSVKTADTHGVVYTPQEIVDFMCSSVEHVLKTEFDLSLSSPDVRVLDPCTGTGNFVVNLLRRVEPRHLPRVYKEQLFANEVMLLPYYIAAQNVEHEFYERHGVYEPFPGLCLVDTLDTAHREQGNWFISEENAKRVERQKQTLINVVIGNPPYNAWQLNENDNNKNRKYDVVDGNIRATFAKDSAASNKNALFDVYVKLFRWAIDRLAKRPGIVCFVTNNNFLEGLAFDGFRKHLLRDFTHVYHLDLEGNVRKNPKLSGTAYNVFGIQVGVGITIAVRSPKRKNRGLYFHRVPKDWRREAKLEWLATKGSIAGVNWTNLKPDDRHVWLVPENADEYANMISIGSKLGKSGFDKDVIFKSYSQGVESKRDNVVYDYNIDRLSSRVKAFIEDYNAEVDRYLRTCGSDDVDDFVRYDKVKWSEGLKLYLRRGKHAAFDESKLRTALYRPFSKRNLFFDRTLIERVFQFPSFFPAREAEMENLVMCCTNHSQIPFLVQMTNCIPNDGVGGRAGQCFPFYTYDEDGGNRRENVTDWVLGRFRERYGDDGIGKWDVFYYVYGVLHHPGYRERFGENLRRELPRVPFMKDFRAFAEAGRRLADLHVGYESVEPWELAWRCEGPLRYRVEKMRLSKDKTSLVVNDSLTLADIPAETFEYRLGNRSALDWVIDQYQTKTDKQTGAIVSDPNRRDDPEYIVHLVARVAASAWRPSESSAPSRRSEGPGPSPPSRARTRENGRPVPDVRVQT